MTPAVTIHLRIRVEPQSRPALLRFLREAIPFYQQPGGIRVRLLRDDSDPDRMIELIEYADESAYRLDAERVERDPRMARLLERWRALLAEPPAVEVYREVAMDREQESGHGTERSEQ